MQDIKQTIGYIRALLAGRTLENLAQDVFAIAAFERFLEIISEASRHLPQEWKVHHAPGIRWRQVGDIGNWLRHVYQRVDMQVLWEIYTQELDPLEEAIDRMIAGLDRE